MSFSALSALIKSKLFKSTIKSILGVFVLALVLGWSTPLVYSKPVAKPVLPEVKIIPEVLPPLVESQTGQVIPAEYLGRSVYFVRPRAKWMALTFDDGPWGKTTLEVLDILRKHQVKATFFVIGKHIEMYPKVLQQIHKEGHVIGNHTYSHRYRKMPAKVAQKEIDLVENQLQKLIGQGSQLFRPPGGRMENGLVRQAIKRNDSVVLWSVTTPDYLQKDRNQVIHDIQAGFKPGAIILLHDGGGDRSGTVAALPTLIEAAHKQGYRFVTVPELFQQMSQEEAALSDSQ
ncbi:polysaccharide deacetylase family protein [Deinococcus misasensis]|uniref:polysaccharide deacetylase family protein n=1 Tax=Deinococcus misasensis TaxID=392413 RepID=UPI00068D072F|nr:polysaccharide deacetylase family protein [Deinococcus misasensis]